jgi:hypothetical protein
VLDCVLVVVNKSTLMSMILAQVTASADGANIPLSDSEGPLRVGAISRWDVLFLKQWIISS